MSSNARYWRTGRNLGAKFFALLLLSVFLAAEALFAAPAQASRPVCKGTPEKCLQTAPGWAFEGKAIDDPYFFDVCVIKLTDGRFRLFGGQQDSTAITSYISDDAKTWELEPGARLENFNAYLPYVAPLDDGRYRMFYATRDNTALRTAISDDGLTFSEEALVLQAAPENGIAAVKGPRVIRLSDGRWRLFYQAGPDPDNTKVMSLVSEDCLNWAAEEGVRLDPAAVCPPATNFNHIGPILDDEGVYHLYTAANVCGEGYSNERPGIYDFRSEDGLTFTLWGYPVVKEYFLADSYTGNPWDPKGGPMDPFIIKVDQGYRLFFGLYDGANVIEDSAIYSLFSPDLTLPAAEEGGDDGDNDGDDGDDDGDDLE